VNIVKFCENRYQELTFKSQSEKEYDCNNDAETKAVHYILNTYRTALKWLYVPKCLLDYAKVQLELMDEPKAALFEKIKEMKEKKEAETEAKGTETPDWRMVPEAQE
jgi:hypothetical protein